MFTHVYDGASIHLEPVFVPVSMLRYCSKVRLTGCLFMGQNILYVPACRCQIKLSHQRVLISILAVNMNKELSDNDMLAGTEHQTLPPIPLCLWLPLLR